jgi:hypothetical protein
MVAARGNHDVWTGAFTQLLAEHSGEFLAA